MSVNLRLQIETTHATLDLFLDETDFRTLSGKRYNTDAAINHLLDDAVTRARAAFNLTPPDQPQLEPQEG